MSVHSVYNFEFPPYVDSLSLNGYIFKRVQDYGDKLGQLQHIHHLDKRFGEFGRTPNYGGHAITAEVITPTPEPPAILKWGKQGVTHLDDILLLLSLFTGRHVWQKEVDEGSIVADHRKYEHGRFLRKGLPAVFDNNKVPPIDIGFEPGINRVIQHISDQKWIDKYRGGHYLFIANHAFRKQILETQFSLCYTIWEHLFSVHNDSWLEPKSIHRIAGEEKMAFMLSEYGIQINASHPSDKIVQTRNRLIHFGMFPDDGSMDYAVDFIKNTELLIARTLGLFRGYSPFSV